MRCARRAHRRRSWRGAGATRGRPNPSGTRRCRCARRRSHVRRAVPAPGSRPAVSSAGRATRRQPSVIVDGSGRSRTTSYSVITLGASPGGSGSACTVSRSPSRNAAAHRGCERGAGAASTSRSSTPAPTGTLYHDTVIISHEHKFVFVKTHKTAGTSIEVFLERIAGDNAVVTPISPPVDGHRPRNYERPDNPFRAVLWQAHVHRPGGTGATDRACYKNHLDARGIKRRLGPRRWDSYFTFCFERNPWDKVVSEYYWRRSNETVDLTFAQVRSRPGVAVRLRPVLARRANRRRRFRRSLRAARRRSR